MRGRERSNGYYDPHGTTKTVINGSTEIVKVGVAGSVATGAIGLLSSIFGGKK